MRIAELLALLGRSWVLLFVYPGGLGILLALVSHRRNDTISYVANVQSWLALICPWLGLALLPLPFAVHTGRSIDILVAFILLEMPQLLLAISEARKGQITRLAAMLNSYPLLIMSILLLATPTGSFDIAQLVQVPADSTSLLINVAHWFGAAGLVLALPVLLGIGPFACPAPTNSFAIIGLRLRGIAISTLALLPIVQLIPEDRQWLLPFPIGILVLFLYGVQRIGAGHAPRPWAQTIWWLSLAGLGLLGVVAVY